MTYRPDEQALKEPAKKVLAAFDELENACKERFESGDWSLDHYSELSNLLAKMAELRGAIAIVTSNTW